MFKYIQLVCSFLFFTSYSHAGTLSVPLAFGVVNSDADYIQISTLKDELSNDNVLVCSSAKKECTSYNGDDFSKGQGDNSVEDIETGQEIFSYDYTRNGAHSQDFELAFIYPRSSPPPQIEFGKTNEFIISEHDVNEVVSYCTSSEGVHVYSKPSRIHLYYSLGYDVESTCSDEVYK